MLGWRSRFALAGLHFLSGGYTGGFESSEFVLWDPKRGACFADYTYPYELFHFHAARVADQLAALADELGIEFPETHRMVVVDDFLKFVADENAEEMAYWQPAPKDGSE